MSLLRIIVIAVCCGISQLTCAASSDYVIDSEGSKQSSKDVVIVQLREDTFLGSPDGPSTPPHSSRKVESMEGVISKGIYLSPYQGYQIRIPTVAGNPRVHVHQSLVSRRPDGTPITSHVLFVPDGGYGAATIVVTRLRDDRAKDTASVLSHYEPSSPAEYSMLEKQGVTYLKLEGPLGTSIQRTIRNRAFTWHFPYRVFLDPSHTKGTIGISRYVVMGEFFCEFSIIVDGSLAPTTEALQLLGERELDILMGAMIKKPL